MDGNQVGTDRSNSSTLGTTFGKEVAPVASLLGRKRPDSVNLDFIVDTAEFTLQEHGDVLVVALDAPTTRNSMSVPLMRELSEVFRNPIAGKKCRCVVLTSTSDSFFCSGFRLNTDAPDALASGEATQAADQLFRAMVSCPVPTIASVSGAVRGAGVELALRCDLRVSGSGATFGVPAGRLGLLYPPQSINFLIQRVGVAAVTWLMLGGATVDAETAKMWGLVHDVVGGDVTDASLAVASRIASSAPLVVAYMRAALGIASDEMLISDDALGKLSIARSSQDYAEALRAVGAKRTAIFNGY